MGEQVTELVLPPHTLPHAKSQRRAVTVHPEGQLPPHTVKVPESIEQVEALELPPHTLPHAKSQRRALT